MDELQMADSQSSTPAQSDPAEALRAMVMGFRTTQIVYVVAKLGIADLLRDGARSSDALALACGADAAMLYRLLRAAASLGLLVESADAHFSLTEVGRTLQRSAHGSPRDIALLYGSDWMWRAYGALEHSVRTGATAFDHVHGEGLFEYLARNTAAAAVFDASMSAFTQTEIAAILAAYDFSPYKNVVDVGGGRGALVAALAAMYPTMSAVVHDRAPLKQAAELLWRDEGVEQRCHFIAGDFFQSIPADGDLYIIKRVIHDWNDAQTVAILRNCRRAMPTDSKLLLMERVVPEGNGMSEAELFDINMMVSAGGRERTRAEYASLCAQAGFDLARMHATRSQLSVLEAHPV